MCVTCTLVIYKSLLTNCNRSRGSGGGTLLKSLGRCVYFRGKQKEHPFNGRVIRRRSLNRENLFTDHPPVLTLVSFL